MLAVLDLLLTTGLLRRRFSVREPENARGSLTDAEVGADASASPMR